MGGGGEYSVYQLGNMQMVILVFRYPPVCIIIVIMILLL